MVRGATGACCTWPFASMVARGVAGGRSAARATGHTASINSTAERIANLLLALAHHVHAILANDERLHLFDEPDLALHRLRQRPEHQRRHALHDASIDRQPPDVAAGDDRH